jgi:FAD dependent oxidoreductase
VRTDMFGTSDGTAPQPYIRESRRIAQPLVQVREQDIAAPTAPRAPTNFKDSVGIGHYPADVHECYGPPGTPYVDAGTIGPFQVPLGALIPKDATNYIAGCKNLGATHITGGAYRVHPVEWAIGEAAGTFAAYCVGQQVAPAAVHAASDRIAALQSRLLQNGAPIFWWDDVSYDADPTTFTAIQLLGARGTFEGDGKTLNFDPGGDFPQASRDAIDQRENHAFNWPSGSLTRAQAAVLICEQLGLPL